jgi:HEPN domain-containing protein
MVTEGICCRCWRVARLCPGQLELLLVDGVSHMGAWRDGADRGLDRVARDTLWVDQATAGKSYPITLESRRVRLTLPLENLDDVIHATLRELPSAPRFPGRLRPGPLRAPRVESGTAQVVPNGLLVVTAVRLRILAEGDLALRSYTDWPITTVADAFGTWLTHAETWLDAWTGAVRQPVTRSGMPRIQAAIPADDGSLGGVGTGGPVPVVIRGQRWAAPGEVTAAFAAASCGLDVPLAHIVLRRSLVELHAGEYRLCVIDACSAAEIALDAALTAQLRARGLRDGEIEGLLRLASGISQAFSLYRDVVMAGQSAVSQNRIGDQLARPRNRAVHAGDHPDEAVAKRAFETAALLVREAVPLPGPAAILTATRARSRRR